MMDLFTKFGIGMRALVYLRSISKSLARIAASQESYTAFCINQWTTKQRTGKGKMTEISYFDQEAANTRYYESRGE